MGDERPSLPENGESESSQWVALAAIAFLALLVAGGLWLAGSLSDANSKLECLESGRTNCVPISAPIR